jgi:hypothetical protein
MARKRTLLQPSMILGSRNGRRLYSVGLAGSDDEFETAIAAWRAHFLSGSPRRSFESFLSDPRANSSAERERTANIARIISTANALAKAHEFDASRTGEMMRQAATLTIEIWSAVRDGIGEEIGLKTKGKQTV